MAISQRARDELQAFAREAEHAAQLHNEPWRRARLQTSTLRAIAGETIHLTWVAPAVLPTFLQLGDNAPWEPVAPEGRREVTVEFADLSARLRVGPHLAQQLRVQVHVPSPALDIFPAARFNAPFGGCAALEIYALHARELTLREHPAAPWRNLPPRCALEFPNHIAPRRLELRLLGWENSLITRTVHIGVDQSLRSGRFEHLIHQARTNAHHHGKLAEPAPH